jgi:hypothetical protein
MTMKPRLLPVMGAALLSISAAGAVGAKEPAVQLPDQVLTDQSAAVEAAPAARSAVARSASAAPSAEDLKAQLIHMTSESSEGLVAVKTAGGGQRMDLEERFMSVMVAVPAEDGHVETSCVTGDHALHTVDAAQKMSAGEMPKKAAQSAPAKLEEK